MGDDLRTALTGAQQRFARQAWENDDAARALEFLNAIPADDRQADVEHGVCERLMKSALVEQRWGHATSFAERLVATGMDAEFAERRLAVLRGRASADLTDQQFDLMLDDPEPSRLPDSALVPEVDAVLAIGTYVARNTPSKLTRLLRAAKNGTGSERDGAMTLLGSLFARFICDLTDLLEVADLCTAVPADPDRWLERDRRSLPDVLARATERHCGLPFEPDLLERTPGRAVKMSELDRTERLRQVRGLYRSGSQARSGRARTVLLIDDITTSGATLRACGTALRDAGAACVIAATIAHTEG